MWHQSILKSYENVQRWNIDIYEYYQEELYQLHLINQKLRQLTKFENHNDRLANHVRSICYLLNQLISLPLPPCNILDEAEKLYSLSQESKDLSRHLPGLALELLSLQELITSITRADSEIALKLMELPEHFQKNNSVFCVDKRSLVKPVIDYLSELELPFSVDTFQQAIKKQPQWENIIIAGPTHWFTGKILLPPCQHLHIIKPTWFDTPVVFPKPFADSEYYIEGTTCLTKPEVAFHKLHISATHVTIPIEVIEENNTLFLESASRLVSSHDNEETLPAYGISLADKTIVFMAELSNTHILSLTSSNSLNVEFSAIKNLQAGQFMLFRNDDNLSETFGDELLKHHGIDWKKTMNVWKEKLRKEINYKGSNRVINQLKIYGSSRVNYQNLINWVYSAIAPKHDDDFRAILRLTGMEDQLDNLRKLASKVRGSRQSAAHELRQLLREQLSEFDINQLIQTGIQSIDLLGSGHSQYTAIRIEEITNRTIPVGVSRLKRQIPFTEYQLSFNRQ